MTLGGHHELPIQRPHHHDQRSEHLNVFQSLVETNLQQELLSAEGTPFAQRMLL